MSTIAERIGPLGLSVGSARGGPRPSPRRTSSSTRWSPAIEIKCAGRTWCART